MKEQEKIKKKNYDIFIWGIIVIAILGLFFFISQPIKTTMPNKIISSLISPAEAVLLINKNAKNEDFVILDVRTLEEHFSEKLKNSQNIDFYSRSFQEEINELDKNKTYLIYCRSGNRSGQAFRIMQEFGFTKVYDLNGGLIEWKNTGIALN